MIALLSADASLYSTRVIREALQQQGHKVRVLDVFGIEVRIGSGCYFEGERLEPQFVIPRFSGASLLAGLAVLREWEREGVPLLNPPSSLERAHSQLTTLQTLAAHHLPIARTSFCSQPSEKTLAMMAENEAKVVKLLDSAQGKGVTLCPNQTTTKSLLTTLATLRSSGLTQAYHPESGGRDQRLICLGGEVIAAVERCAPEGDFRSNLHRGGKAQPLSPSAESIAIATQSCAALGLTFAGVDLLLTHEGIVVLELNASPGLEGVEAVSKVPVSTMLAELVSKRIAN